MGGWVGGWLRFLLILRVSPSSLAGVGAGAELGNFKLFTLIIILDYGTLVPSSAQHQLKLPLSWAEFPLFPVSPPIHP